MMIPKGLAAAVLAGLPMQYGVTGGEIIREITYIVVLTSISFTAILVALYQRPAVQQFYSSFLKKPVKSD